jgi:hypothetical protein
MVVRDLVRATLHAATLVGSLVLGAACTDALGSGGEQVAILVVPEFGELAPFAANADRLRLVVTRVSNATVETDDTVSIDLLTGEAVVQLQLSVPSGPEQFTVFLQAIRSGDGLVLFEGTQTVSVTAGATTPAEVPVTYVGPAAASVEVQPRDTAIGPGASFTFNAVARDAAQAVVASPVTFTLVTPADSLILNVRKYTGVATAGTSATGTVRVVARTPDGRTDTARVSVGAVPAGLRVTPGFAVLGNGATLTLAANLVDANGVVIGPAGSVSWTSRAPTVAAVSGSGVVTVASGASAVIVGTAGSFSDSMLVRVAAPGDVPVSAVAAVRAFHAPRVGEAVVVDVTADMGFAGGELLGSYNAQLTWNPAVLTYVGVDAGGFGAPTVNDTQAQEGSLRFSAANAQGVGGVVVVARVRFLAQATGNATPQLSITELSAAQTFTNLLSSVIVTNGSVTVRP